MPTRRAKLPPTVAVADGDAYAPGPRAAAILRGREIAEADLRQSGGSFSLPQVCRLLNGISRQRVDQMVKAGKLLAVPGPNNRRRYPVAQFQGDGTLIDGLAEVQAALPTRNPWAVLNFLVNPDDRLAGKRPVDLLAAGKRDRVIAAAERLAEPGG